MGRSVDAPTGFPVRPEIADLSGAVRAAQQGSSDAFRTLYRDTQPRLLRYLYTLVGDDAEDVASETWLQVTRDLASFTGDHDGFRGWVTTIGRHRALDHLRRRGHRRPPWAAHAGQAPGGTDLSRAGNIAPVSGMHPFHLESITAGGDCAVLRIEGDIDAYAAPQIRERVIDLAGNGTVHIIADLRGAGFLDSSGLGALVGSRKELGARGGSLMLVVGPGRVLQALRMTGLSDAFALHSCVPDAIAADQHWQAAVSGEGDSTEEWCRKHRLP
jgi:anti-anti-sigma factor